MPSDTATMTDTADRIAILAYADMLAFPVGLVPSQEELDHLRRVAIAARIRLVIKSQAELTIALACAMRIIFEEGGTDDFMALAKRKGLHDGIGVRAKVAIAHALREPGADCKHVWIACGRKWKCVGCGAVESGEPQAEPSDANMKRLGPIGKEP